MGASLNRLAMSDPRDGPLPVFLMLLTIVTGLVDAVSYLALGHVFVANMTGNVVFLAFAVVDAQEFSVPASFTAIVAFLLGALVGGRLARWQSAHRGRLFGATLLLETSLVGLALAVSLIALVSTSSGRYPTILALSVAMGLQNATARRLAVPDLTTTVLTLTLTGFAADSKLAGGTSPRFGRRIIATASMFLGAAIGALVVLSVGASAVLMLALVLLATVLATALPHWRTTDAWTSS